MVLPAPYPPRTPEEIQAINTLKAMLDPHQVIAHIEELNTVPDVDGHLDVLDDSLRPIAKLEVQVKKLPDNYGDTPKLQIPLSIFGYASTATNNPVLLIGVDTNRKKAYWYHIPTDANPKPGQQTTIVHFPLTQLIDGKNVGYIAEWFQIFVDRTVEKGALQREGTAASIIEQIKKAVGDDELSKLIQNARTKQYSAEIVAAQTWAEKFDDQTKALQTLREVLAKAVSENDNQNEMHAIYVMVSLLSSVPEPDITLFQLTNRGIELALQLDRKDTLALLS